MVLARDAVPCPRCKFPNFSQSATCRLCEAPLGLAPREEGRETTRLRRDELPVGDYTRPSAVGSRRATAAEGDPGVVAWVHCAPFPPIPLSESSLQLSVGRAAECDVVLPHHSISRCHGVFWVHNGQVQFQDRSSNGTFLNGKRVRKATLQLGDVLTIGPYDLEICGSEPQAATAEMEGTSEIDFASFQSGLLAETPMVETLQGLEFGRKTGTLSILSGRLRGHLVLHEGVPWFARLGDREGEAAVLDMLALAEGRFIFSPSPEPGERAMRSTITGLLLEFSRQSDEQTHASDPPTQF